MLVRFLCLLALSAMAAFSGVIFYSGIGGSGAPVPDGYGAIAEMATSTRTVSGFGNTTETVADMLYWNDSFSGQPAIYSGSLVGEITLAATGVNTIKLNDFFLGGWPSADKYIDIRVYDLAYNELIRRDAVFVPGTSGLYFGVNLTRAAGGGFIIQGYSDLFNGGINLIDYGSRTGPSSRRPRARLSRSLTRSR